MKISKMKSKFVEKLPDVKISLLGLKGSRALGIPESADCDYDYMGFYVADNSQVFSIFNKPKEQFEYNDKELDYVIYEVEKFLRLATSCNPSILEMLYLTSYNHLDNIGKTVLSNRNLFLSEKAVRNAFGGYVLSQILYLKRNHKFKHRQSIEKHIRHCFRLFDQGQELLETGKITIKLKDPQKYFDLAKDSTNIEKMFRLFEDRDKEFRACKSILPDKSDKYWIDQLLIKIRSNKIV